MKNKWKPANLSVAPREASQSYPRHVKQPDLPIVVRKSDDSLVHRHADPGKFRFRFNRNKWDILKFVSVTACLHDFIRSTSTSTTSRPRPVDSGVCADGCYGRPHVLQVPHFDSSIVAPGHYVVADREHGWRHRADKGRRQFRLKRFTLFPIQIWFIRLNSSLVTVVLFECLTCNVALEDVFFFLHACNICLNNSLMTSCSSYTPFESGQQLVLVFKTCLQ